MRAQLIVLSLITASAMVVRNGKQAGPHMSVEEIIKMIQAHPNIMTTNHHPKNVPANISVKGADYTAAEKAIYDDMADTKKIGPPSRQSVARAQHGIMASWIMQRRMQSTRTKGTTQAHDDVRDWEAGSLC